MTSFTKTFFLLLVVLQLAAVTPVLSRSSTSTRGNRSRHTLYRPAAAYKWLYPIHASFDAVIASLSDLQSEVIDLFRTLFTYFAIYHDLYYFVSKLIMTLLTGTYNLCHRLFLSVNLPSFSSWPAAPPVLRRFTSTNQNGYATLLSVPVRYLAVALVAATVVAFCALSESGVARRVRRVSAFVARLVMVPPVFVTMDVTPVVHGLLRIVSKSVRVVIALLALVLTIVRAAVMAVLTGGPVFTVSVVVSMLAAGVGVWWWCFSRPNVRTMASDPGSTTRTRTARETAATEVLSNTSTTSLSPASPAQRQSPSQNTGDDDRNDNTDGQSVDSISTAAAADTATKMSCCSGCKRNDNGLPVVREIVDADINNNSQLSSSSSSNDVAQEGLRQRRTASSSPPVR